MIRARLAHGAACLVLGAMVSAGCTGPAGGNPGTTLDVFAASSLSGPMTDIATSFEDAHPGVRVVLTFAGSADLAAQIAEGAPADVFASANESQFARLPSRDADAHVVFATNELTIVVPLGNPAGVTDFASLARTDLTLVTCAPQVPCGEATATLARLHEVTLDPASEEASVTDVLGKVASGEADAGIVYVTDGARERLVESIAIDRSHEALVRCAIAAIAAGDAPIEAAAFIAFVTGPEGQQILFEAGFGGS